MVWTAETSTGYENRKCRHRIVAYLKGRGLDLGCGDEKICGEAIGIDIAGHAADIKLDLSEMEALRLFGNDQFDYVFSSHLLEDFRFPEAALQEWWRVLKYGGHMILYGPDPDYYPCIGTPGCNPNHKKDLYWQDVWQIIKGFGNAKLISHSRHNQSNEYSWQLVVRKQVSLLARPFEFFLGKPNGQKEISFPRKKVTNRECLIIRYGALGDALWVTPALRELKKEGWHIVYNCTPYSAQVLQLNPYIDEWLLQGKDVIPNQDLPEYWADFEGQFEKVINFSGSVEGSLLKMEGSDEFDWPHNRRHKECNVNYMDKTMAVAGFPHQRYRGRLPELHFSEIEEMAARQFRENNKDRFIVVWSLSGSSIHKAYPWAPYVAGEIAKNHEKDALIVTVGGDECRMIEWRNPVTMPKAGALTIRQSMLLTKYADLVIGPETGVLNAASCFETPKIIFLSHSSEENLTKYWKNCTALHPESCKCHPCHRLIFTDPCPKGKDKVAARCAENIRPETVYKAFLTEFKKWKAKR